MARLGELGDQFWERYDAPDRAGGPAEALCGLDAESMALRLYEQAAHRLLHRSLGLLRTLRREGTLAEAPKPEPGPALAASKNEANPPATRPAEPAAALSSEWWEEPPTAPMAAEAEPVPHRMLR